MMHSEHAGATMTKGLAQPILDDALIERLVEERVAQRFAREAFHWRLRLIAVETLLIGILVLIAGLILRQPTGLVLRGSLLVSASCLASGIFLLELSAGTAKLAAWLKRKWQA